MTHDRLRRYRDLPVRRALLLIGAAAAAVALTADPAEALSAAARSWSPFILVIGLLLVGVVAHGDGMFQWGAAATGRLGGGGAVLFLALLGLVAVVSVVLNLDTAVAFLTPILVLSARRRGLREAPFLYGSLFMANAASLLLPGSNLTNLLVLARERTSGAGFAARMLPAWIAAILVTALVLVLRYRRDLAGSGSGRVEAAHHDGTRWLGATATVLAGFLIVIVPSAALPVLAIGVATVGLRLNQGRLRPSDVAGAVDLVVLAGLFGLTTALGTIAGVWTGPAELMASAGRWESAAIGVLGALAVNNLPAAVLLSARTPAHPGALLIGLDLGPNLAVTGSLSAIVWYQAAKTVGARPSLLGVTRMGLTIVPCSVVAAMIASAIFAPGRL